MDFIPQRLREFPAELSRPKREYLEKNIFINQPFHFETKLHRPQFTHTTETRRATLDFQGFTVS